MGVPLRLAVVFFLLPALFATSVASAADNVEPERMGNLYWFGNFGLFNPKGDIGELNTGWNLSGGVGSRVHPNIAVESTLAFMRSSGSPGDLWAIPLTVGARLIYPTPVFEPYVGAGFGFYYVSLDKPRVDDTAFTLGGYLSAGADAWLNRQIALNAELKYQYMNPKLSGSHVDTSGLVFTLGIRMGF